MSVIIDDEIIYNNHQIESWNEIFNAQEKLSKMAEMDYIDSAFASWASNNIGKTIEGCYIVDLSDRQAIVMTPDGVKFVMPYRVMNFDKKYLKIGKEFSYITIDKVSGTPPKILVSPTPVAIGVKNDSGDNQYSRY